ncbi:MAG: transposase, partial [Clostridiales bacterium GWC2_40_7]
MNTEFRKRMYEILDLYQEPYDPRNPVLGVDEKPKQLIEDSRKPIPMLPGKAEKYDYEYIRNSKANIFVAVEPKHGKRITQVTKQRTKKDFAKFMRDVVLSYPYAKKLRIVLDNLNTHFESSFYETFGKDEAEKILSKLEFHYTPKHASWLNVAETEIGALDTQCTARRMKNISFLQEEVRSCTKMR